MSGHEGTIDLRLSVNWHPRRCPVAECVNLRPAGRVMCAECWARVPAQMRHAVALTWHPEEESREYQYAVAQAVLAAARRSAREVYR